MHALRALALAAATLVLSTAAPAAPRCPEDGDGGACVWGRVEGFEAGAVQVRGLRIQLIGIHVPGPRDLCSAKGGEFPCARPAKKRVGELVAKGGVACDILDAASDTLYGRCRVTEGDLARLLVASGVARAVKDGPLEADQAAAMTAHKGLWAAEITPPKDWEAVRRRGERE